MSIYDTKPERLLECLVDLSAEAPPQTVYCAGFELKQWRCVPLSRHLIEWLPEYALAEEELHTHHGNAYVKLQQAAVRVYTSEKYEKRGEAGEIALHAICRDFFSTIPISPRVFYKSTSNDVIKSFDMVHARFPENKKFEIWLGESKLYTKSASAIKDAISSIKTHIEQGFLTNQKLILGPQIPKTTPHYEEILEVFKTQASLDKFINAAVFVVGIMTNSPATAAATTIDDSYKGALEAEIATLVEHLRASGLCGTLRLVLVYVPLGSKTKLVSEFDKRLKGLQ